MAASSNYLKAVAWFLLHILISNINDLIAKKLGNSIPGVEIVFLRFLCGTLVLLPFMFSKNVGFATKHPLVHMGRGLLLFGGISIWCICLQHVQLVLVTLMSFAIPIFFIILAYFLLKEQIGWQRLVITMLGFIGVLVVLNPTSVDFKPISLLLIVGVVLFALLDVINKKYISQESIINMLFYSSLFTTLFSLIPTLATGFVMPNWHDVSLTLVLGAGANLLLYALLKSFSLAEASSLSPLRYTELLLSATLGYLIFGEVPTSAIYIGAAVIVPCNIALVYYESKKTNDI